MTIVDLTAAKIVNNYAADIKIADEYLFLIFICYFLFWKYWI